MTIAQALTQAVAEQGWNATSLAAEFGVTEASARRWLAGTAVPAGEMLLRLQRELPGFGDLLREEIAS